MTAPALRIAPLPYVDALTARDPGDIDTVVIHCTELPDLATARAYGERVLYASGTGNSGHYYIDRDGRTTRFVADTRVAHHTFGYNPRSIGTYASYGCIRMHNEDVVDLYARVRVGTPVVVTP